MVIVTDVRMFTSSLSSLCLVSTRPFSRGTLSAPYCLQFAEKLVKLTFAFSVVHSVVQLKLMWGNLTLASSEKKDVLVPSLPSGQVGTVSVEFVAPNIEGTYTSHWRLSHRGEQFGPRIWCSIVVDPSPATDYLESNCQKDKASSTKQASD